MDIKDLGADRALVPAASSLQAVSTKGFDHGERSTPGPWAASIERKPFGTGGHWYVITDAEENGLGEFYGDDHEANVANAHIAAAAPTLIEALEDVSRRCPAYTGDLDEHSQPSDGWTPDEYAREFELFHIARIGDVARAAIAKAKVPS